MRLFLTLCLLWLGIWPATADATPLELTITPVPLNEADGNLDRVGKLIYRGGFEVRGSDPNFGGLSALGISDDGTRFVALTDEGHRVDGTLAFDDDHSLRGIDNAEIFALAGDTGVGLYAKDLADAEAMAPGVNGEMIVAFERRHRIWVYIAGVPAPQVMRPPAELKRAPRNGGIEALALLDDGRLFALTESLGIQDRVIGWVSSRRGWEPVTYQVDDGFVPTGATTLPSGDVLVLERHFTPREQSRARIKRLPASAFEPGADLQGEVVALIQDPLTVDNFEGIEAFKGPKGETLVIIVSDDNFSRRNPQRTLMMMFELESP